MLGIISLFRYVFGDIRHLYNHKIYAIISFGSFTGEVQMRKKQYMEADIVEKETKDAPSSVLQKCVEEAVGKRPLLQGEMRGIKGMPNHFITVLGPDNHRAHVVSVKVGDQVILVHEVPSDGASPETIFLPRKRETDIGKKDHPVYFPPWAIHA